MMLFDVRSFRFREGAAEESVKVLTAAVDMEWYGDT